MILAVWIGLYPKPFIDRLDSSVVRVMTRVNSADVPLNADAASEDATSPVVVSDLLALDGDTGDGAELPVRGGAR